MTIGHSGRAMVAGVMGFPVAHSLSPQLHGHWLASYGIDGVYVPMPVQVNRLEQALRALPVLGFRGCNLTLPLKERALDFVDHVEEAGRLVGAVNTVVVLPDGSLSATNTDALGFARSLAHALPGWSLAGQPALVLGAGGAARAVLMALTEFSPRQLRVVGRNDTQVAALRRPGLDIEAWPWDRLDRAVEDAALLVNTTPLGMSGSPSPDVPLDRLAAKAVVVDVVYTPLMTPLLKQAEALGFRTVDGLGMLMHQAREGFRRWFGVDPEVTPLLRERLVGQKL